MLANWLARLHNTHVLLASLLARHVACSPVHVLQVAPLPSSLSRHSSTVRFQDVESQEVPKPDNLVHPIVFAQDEAERVHSTHSGSDVPEVTATILGHQEPKGASVPAVAG